MRTTWGIVLIAASALAWGGQTLSWLAPGLATDLGLTEGEDDVDPAFHADVRGEARIDALSLWVLLVAGILLVLDRPVWSTYGLIGGGIYAYFAGRGLSTRLDLHRRGIRIGTPSDVRTAVVFLTLWGVIGVVTIVAAAADAG